MTIANVASAIAQMAVNSDATLTTSSIDTSGANFIAVAIAVGEGATGFTVTDNKSNGNATATAATYAYVGAGTRLTIYIWENPTVGSGHTFTLNKGTGSLSGGMAVRAFSGVATSSSTDQTSVNNTPNTTSVQPGSITPTEANELVLCAWTMAGNGVTDTPTTSGLTAASALPRQTTGGGIFPIGLGYVIQTSAAAVNPTWSWTNADYATSVIASFKQAAGGGGGVFGSNFYRQVAGMGA